MTSKLTPAQERALDVVRAQGSVTLSFWGGKLMTNLPKGITSRVPLEKLHELGYLIATHHRSDVTYREAKKNG